MYKNGVRYTACGKRSHKGQPRCLKCEAIRRANWTPLYRKAHNLHSSLARSGTKVSFKEIRDLISVPHHCPYCKEVIQLKDISLDHVIPLSRGGKAHMSNLQPTCFKCNRTKGALTGTEFSELLNFLSKKEYGALVLSRLRAAGFAFKSRG